jgi:MoxR-like ATPase
MPGPKEQVAVLERNQRGDPAVKPVLDGARIREMQAMVREVQVALPIREYIANILAASRDHPDLALGLSPRAGIHLQRAAQALAAILGFGFAAPEHVKAVSSAVLTHRVLLAPGAKATAIEVMNDIVQSVPVPV